MIKDVNEAIEKYFLNYLLLSYVYSDEVALNYPEKLTNITKRMMEINLEFKLSEVDKSFEEMIYDIESSIISKTDFSNVKSEHENFITKNLEKICKI